jgi:cytochrome c553
MKKMLLTAMLGMILAMSTSAMAVGNAAAGKTNSVTCAACHGADGNSPTDAFPKLAGQGAAYLVKQLIEFKSGVRNNAIMASMVANLSEQDMADLAAFYASKKVTPGAVPEDLLVAGQKIFRAGNKKSGVPACMACHGPTGAGIPAAKWPALSGQHSAYVEAQLKMFANGTRHNSPNGMMADIASKMSAEEMKAVAAYVAGLH